MKFSEVKSTEAQFTSMGEMNSVEDEVFSEEI